MYTGILRSHSSHPGEDVVQYHLQLDDEQIALNPFIGGYLRVAFEGEKRCIYCGRKSNKLFNGGYCYPCFQTLARNDICMVKPNLCHYETCREPEWGDQHCMIPTYVYLAKSSDIKVGITRNLPGRWLNQGAVEAIPIAVLPTRKMAGELELFLMQHLPDKTNWRKMLKGEVVDASLLEVRERVLGLIPDEYRSHILTEEVVRRFHYPVSAVPDKIASHDLDKGPAEGTLLGLKGNYLIFDSGVLNLPKFTGYRISLQVGA
ncbi:MAG: DUF2797 domain-containing protein [Mycobacterium leprae]